MKVVAAILTILCAVALTCSYLLMLFYLDALLPWAIAATCVGVGAGVAAFLGWMAVSEEAP